MHARYFASKQGRFSSADSFGGSIANPQSLNRYAYVMNNPMNFSDPTGHEGRYSAHGVTNWMHHTEGSLMLGGQSQIDAAMKDYEDGYPDRQPANAETSKGEEDPGTDGKAAADGAPQDAGPRNDCLVAAAMVDIFASESSTDPGFVNTLYDRFKDPNDHSFTSQGFKEDFVDPTNESPNQVRHTTGAIFFWLCWWSDSKTVTPDACMGRCSKDSRGHF